MNSRYAVIAFSGEWKDDTTMTLQGVEEAEGRCFRQEFTFRWRSPDEIRAH